jgi:alkylhydroperoxidase family enzyme
VAYGTVNKVAACKQCHAYRERRRKVIREILTPVPTWSMSCIALTEREREKGENI